MKPLFNDVYITMATRTPIGRLGGALSTLRVDDLLAALIKENLPRFTFPLDEIEDVIIGCANQAGEDNRNIARMSALLAGLPETVPGLTINRLCASSLEALAIAAAKIESGATDCLLVGGVEGMSRAPYVLSKATSAFDRGQTLYDTALGWRFPNPAMEKLFPLLSMGETAEEVATKCSISREAQDEFAYESHMKAARAQSLWSEEITPLHIPAQGKGSATLFHQDEGIRPDSSLEKLQTLRPVFRKNGSVTAGNSSSLNDGASLLLVVSGAFLKRHNLKPLARLIGSASAGLHPNIMGLGPVHSTQKLCTKMHMKPQDFQTIELNEAFAAQVLGSIKELHIDAALVNPQGGAIALGHPLGCSGARIVTTLVHRMKREKSLKYGLASMCVGVGLGVSLAVENI
jgi:acetyl-CoA acetyltransferase family protein